MVNQDVIQILEERGKTHGDYDAQSALSQMVKELFRASPLWGALIPGQREAIEMIVTKLSRAVCGNARHEDHWADIIGYATLVLNELRNAGKLGGSGKYVR